LPAKGATYSMPRVCWDRVKQREPPRRKGYSLFAGQARTRSGAWIRAIKVAEGRRAEPLLGAAPVGPQAVVRPGPGRTKKIGGTSYLALAAGFSETGSIASRD
jgi:hypothetical protein